MAKKVTEVFDPKRKCAKCGSGDIRNQYGKAGKCYAIGSEQNGYFGCSVAPEIIWQHCNRCHYGWPVKPIDSGYSTVVSEPGAAIEVRRINLSEDDKKALAAGVPELQVTTATGNEG